MGSSIAKRLNMAALALAVLVLAPTACGSGGPNTAHGVVSSTHASAKPTTSAAQLAIHRAVVAECANAQALDTSVTSATTVGEFESGVGGWEAQLTAASHIPLTGVPESLNTARQIQLDYDEANLALALAAEYDNPFGRFSAGKVRRGYNTAASKLQDVLNRCAAAGA